mmetsp:Transcript_41731/g.121990  ORF Transcript_41731/g.121990 Transcript_41731/m.121990 type:complete len:208 (-) Transcript_41731:1474-2097(-)
MASTPPDVGAGSCCGSGGAWPRDRGAEIGPSATAAAAAVLVVLVLALAMVSPHLGATTRSVGFSEQPCACASVLSTGNWVSCSTSISNTSNVILPEGRVEINLPAAAPLILGNMARIRSPISRWLISPLLSSSKESNTALITGRADSDPRSSMVFSSSTDALLAALSLATCRIARPIPHSTLRQNASAPVHAACMMPESSMLNTMAG